MVRAMHTILRFATLLIAAALFGPLGAARAQTPVPEGVDRYPGADYTAAGAAAPATAYKGVVSAADPRAAAAGREILEQGGSASDAAAAVMLALTVVEPQSSGIGGGGFLVYQPARGRPSSIDGRETAPAIASPRQFLGADGKPLGFAEASTGGRAVGVPGSIALIAQAHRRWGKLPWAALFAPAIRLAEGFEMSGRMVQFIGYGRPKLMKSAEGRALYLDPQGAPLAPGTRFANPALAATLRTIAKEGPDAFYKGPVGAALVQAVNTAEAAPVAMTMADLGAYRAVERPLTCGRYRSYTVCGMDPPSSGSVGVLQMLGQLERFDMKGLGINSPVAWHLFIESQRLAYADRDKWIGDPGFIKVPVAGLVAPAYIRSRSALISPTTRIVAAKAGMPRGAPPRVAANDNEVAGTSSFAVAAPDGAVAAYTSTVESVFGSGLVSQGFVLNNELTDFNFAPEDQGALTANRVAPGKRPRSSMSPTLVYDSKGKIVAAIGAAGGTTIIAQVAKAIIAMVDWGLPIDRAIGVPQAIGIGDRLSVEKGTMLEAMIPALEALGHKPVPSTLPLKGNGVQRVAGGWSGGADPRSEGGIAGY